MMALIVMSAPAVMCETIKTDAPAYQSKGTVMVPMRAIFEWLGAEVTYEVGVITASREGTIVILRPGNATATVNGAPKELASAPQLNNSRVFVPLRFVGEALGATLQWDSASRTATIVQGIRVGTLEVPSGVFKPDKPKTAKSTTRVNPSNSSTKAVGKLSWKSKGKQLDTPEFTTLADGWQVRVRTTNVKPEPGKMTILICENRDDALKTGFVTFVHTESREALLGDKTPNASVIYIREGMDRQLAMAAAKNLPASGDSITREVSALEMFEHEGIARRGVETIRGNITYWGVGSFFPAGKYRISLLFLDSGTGDIDVTVLP